MHLYIRPNGSLDYELMIYHLDFYTKTFNQVPDTSNAQGQAVETRVDTVDYLSSAGQGQQQRSVQVVHQSNPVDDSATSSGVLANAAAAVTSTLQSAKDAISGK